jgi:hypothetical protein
MAHIFWTVLCFATIIWYIVVTAIVAYKGGIDIKNMLNKLEDEKNEIEK